MDRRLSRANWSTKNAKKTFTPAQVSAPIIEKAPAAPAAPAQKPSPKQKRPHKIDNSGVNRRFSVKLNPQEAQSAQKAALAQFPPLPEGAEAAVSETRQQTAIDSSALLSDLSAESFDAVPYVQGYLKDATAAKIDQFARDLGDLASSNDSDVKRTITQSYNQVLAVSRTMVEAEGVLEGLKGPVMKLNEILSSQAEEAQEKMDNGSNRDNRRSVLLLEKKWASNLNSLFKETLGRAQRHHLQADPAGTSDHSERPPARGHAQADRRQEKDGGRAVLAAKRPRDLQSRQCGGAHSVAEDQRHGVPFPDGQPERVQ
ncbi:hypothetical protein KL915_003935 [Ogataea haglerorum]|nr:hypothetical protein KL915_003935 [Ogataea haglerorum]